MHALLLSAKAVIFDADGLLIDSEALWDRTREKFAEKYAKEITPEFHTQFRGQGMKEVITIIKNEWDLAGDVSSLVTEFRNIFYDLASRGELLLMPGVRELIAELCASGKILTVATGGHAKDKIEKILETFGLLHYFTLVVSSDEVDSGKPAPDIFLFTLEKLGIRRIECVILEDSVNGIEAAKRAEIQVIGVQRNEKSRKELSEHGAEMVVRTLEDLL